MENETNNPTGKSTEITPVNGLYEDWFLDYASYVILERAVPAMEDGLKPVQRRIMHAMREMHDGRFHKVANLIGSTMQFHPHGDASIGDAIVALGQKELLIETQGNWGDIRTGDRAAAPRYIEARLSKFALDVVFNPKITQWQAAYDGRKNEPVTFPVKFPLLLAQGVEGIAVGLSTKILPHNFNEIIDGAINTLKNKPVALYPDFQTGGYIDVENYNDGLRGGKIRVRSKIETVDKKTLSVKEIPYGTTTGGLIESIIKANDQGKIKIKKVVDNTAKEVDIEIQMAPGTSPDVTIDALYAFTDCEVSISPNACVIYQDKPLFLPVNELLKISVAQTKDLLKQELEIAEKELQEKILFGSLERIFIENRIYRDIEECETWEAVLETIDAGLDPYKKEFYREITRDDILRLTEIKIKRISKFDSFKADELMRGFQADLDEVRNNLNHLVDYTILYYKSLKTKYGAGKERKTEIRKFDSIEAAVVAANNQKLYIDAQAGFIGYGLKKNEYICDCSDLDDIIVFRLDGVMKVVKIDEKVFVGKNILHAGVYRKGDERMVYNLAYLDAKSGSSYVKRFQVPSVTRDREYDLTKGSQGSKVHYLTANPNGEAEKITVQLSQSSRARNKTFDFDFSELAIKNRGAQGNILTKHPVRKVKFKEAGNSTLGGLALWFDAITGRLNTEERGAYIGDYHGDDRILALYKDGTYEVTDFELTNRYEPGLEPKLQKFKPETVVTAIYFDGEAKTHYVKRFKIETNTLNKPFKFITDHRKSKLELVTTSKDAQVEVVFTEGKENNKQSLIFDVDMLIDVKGWRAQGNKLSQNQVIKLKLIENTPSNDNDNENQLNLF